MQGGHTLYVRGIDLQALPAQGHVRVRGRRFGDLQDGPGDTPSREPLAPGQRCCQRARRVRALGGCWDPLPAQDAAAALLRVRVEGRVGPGFRAAPTAFRSSGSERKLRGTETLINCLLGIVLVPIVVPWGYVLQHYLKAPGARWGKQQVTAGPLPSDEPKIVT